MGKAFGLSSQCSTLYLYGSEDNLPSSNLASVTVRKRFISTSSTCTALPTTNFTMIDLPEPPGTEKETAAPTPDPAEAAAEQARQEALNARRAEALVQDGDVIYIDAGTTTMHLMDFLDSAKHITVLTGNLSAIAQASAKANVELILLPVLNRRTNSVVDGSTLEFLARYQCSKAFMGVSGVSEDGRLCVSTYAEYELKKLAVQRSQMAYLLVDSSKFGGAGLMSYGTLADMTQIITDSGCPDGIRQLCAAKDIDLTVLPEPNRKENVHV